MNRSATRWKHVVLVGSIPCLVLSAASDANVGESIVLCLDSPALPVWLGVRKNEAWRIVRTPVNIASSRNAGFG